MANSYVSVSPIAGTIPFDNTGTSLVSDNVQNAIVELTATAGSFNENLILCDNEFTSLFDNDGNILLGVA